MPVISPVLSSVASPDGVPVITWSGIAPGDTFDPYVIKGQRGLALSVQVSGTFGGATITMQQSNNGTDFVALRDLSNTAISATAAAVFDVSTAAIYIRPQIAGGTSSVLSVRVVLRG
jgi:hypothetical protein